MDVTMKVKHPDHLQGSFMVCCATVNLQLCYPTCTVPTLASQWLQNSNPWAHKASPARNTWLS